MKKGWVAMADVRTTAARANEIVRSYMIGAIGVGLLPFPLLDVALLTGVELQMLRSLARLYGVEFSEELGRSIIASLVGGYLPVASSSLVKAIPLFGPLLGLVSVSVIAGASTYAIGKVFIQHFEAGGSFLTLDPEEVRDYFAEQFEQGKQEVRASYAGIKP